MAAAGADLLALELGGGVALDRVRGELVDVGEDGLGQQIEGPGIEARLAPGAGQVPPGDAGADPVGRLQRVQRAPLAQLAAAEADVDVAAQLAAGVRVADQGDELAEGLAAELDEDPGMRLIARQFVALVLVSLALPALAGYLLSGGLAGALTGLPWGGLVRIFFVHHVTWSVNSICHYFGTQRFATGDRSTNVFWLALPSLGESWHHNHHAFPRSAVHGLRRWEVDPSALFIRALERLGLAWNVVRIPEERQTERLA